MNKFSPLVDPVMSGLSITRWNNYQRIREVTSLDHLAFVAHVSVIIALNSGEKYDIGIILRKVLFSGFFTFKYSDINSDVKHRLKTEFPEIYAGLESKVFDSIFGSIPEGMQKDIENTRIPTKEDALIAFAKTWTSYREAYNNAQTYPEEYEKILQSIRERAYSIQSPDFSGVLQFGSESKTNIEKYLFIIHRLSSSFRWNGSKRSIPVSVLAHSYIVMFYSYIIGMLEGLDEQAITDMMLTALYHDIPEAITGDVITPTKKAVPGLEAALERLEHVMVHEDILSYIMGSDYTALLEKKMLRPWKEDHGSLVKIADILSAYQEARIEGKDPHFESVMERLEKILSETGKGYIESLL